MSGQKKWEYQILEMERAPFGSKILSINGGIPDKNFPHHTYNPNDQTVDLYIYLNDLGQEGWELIGSSPSDSTGDGKNYVIYYLFLKRAL